MPRPLCPATSAASAASMFRPLFEAPIDVIGDIHGECGTLCELLDRLGYDGNGAHPEGRRLVFVGESLTGVPTPPAWRGGWRGTSSSRYAVRTEIVRVYMPCSGC